MAMHLTIILKMSFLKLPVLKKAFLVPYVPLYFYLLCVVVYPMVSLEVVDLCASHMVLSLLMCTPLL